MKNLLIAAILAAFACTGVAMAVEPAKDAAPTTKAAPADKKPHEKAGDVKKGDKKPHATGKKPVKKPMSKKVAPKGTAPKTEPAPAVK